MKKGINNPGFRALPSSVQNNILSNMKYGGKKYAAGGAMPMEQLTEFNEGGRHEENSLGGIPQGMNPSGQMNLVEEGETKFDSENYIYSDSLKIDKELAEAFNLSPKMVGKTFADASKMAGRKNSKREGDAIEMAANEKDLMNLMEAQEAFKQARIEEKLQEISELDPNALPALMGQGQPQGGPQGDPAMGGQMQEAPMDEQAMMEQQMMAQPQGAVLAGGTGETMPEEMAMAAQMQQQGMMRNGGYTRSYNPGGFMGMNMANAGMMNTGAMGMANPCPCGTPGCSPCEGEPNSTEITTENVSRPQAKSRNTNSMIGGIEFSPHLSWTEEAGFEDDRIMQDIRQHMLSNYGAVATSGDPAYGTGVSGTTDGGGDGSSTGGGDDTGGYNNTGKVKDSSGKHKFKKPRIGTRRPIDTSNKWTWWSHHTSGDNRAGKKRYGPKLFQSRRIKTNEFGGNLMQSGQEAGLNPMQGMNQFFNMGGSTNPPFNFVVNPMPNTTPTLEEAQYMTLRTGADGKRSPSAGPKKYFDEAKATLSPTEFQTYKQNLAIGNPNLGMRRGGKLCYGCGGKMHAYGGRMNGIAPNQAKYGKFLDLYSNFLGTGASVLGNIPVVGQAVGAGLGALSGVAGSLAENARTSEDGKVDWRGIDYGDMALQAGKGAGSGALGFAGSTLTNLGGQGVDALTTSKYEERETAHQDIINNPEKYSIEEYEAALAKEQDRGKGSTLFNIANQAMGVAGSIAGGKIGKGAENTMGEVTDSVIETAPEIELPNMVKYGGNLYKNGGKQMIKRADGSYSQRGFWDNIRDNAGSGKKPTKEMLKQEKKINASSKQMGGNLDEYTTDTTFKDGGKLTLMKQITQPDGTLINKSVTYNSLQELLADSEIVQKYGGKENVKELFAQRFQDSNVPYQTNMMNNIVAPDPIYTRVGDMEAQRPLTEEEIAATQITPRETAILQNTRNQLQVTPDRLAELEAAENLERAVDSQNTIFQEDLNKNTIPDYLEQQENFLIEEDKKVEKENKVKTKEEPVIEEDSDKIVETDDIANAKFPFKYKESFPQFAAKYAAPLYNIGSGLFSKQKDYMPDFVPLETPKFDPTQAINNVKRQVSGLRKNLNKVGANPSNLLALAQSGSRLENETLMTYDKLQKELDFRGDQYNTKQKQALKKYQKQLEMSFDEAKRKSIQEGIKQMGKIQETEAANYLAAQYNSMAAPNLGTFEYTPFLEGLLNKMNKKKNK
jgi:hypothetical protein